MPTYEYRNLLEALGDYNAAEAAIKESLDGNDDPSWGYHNQHLTDAREDAAKAFENALDEIITARVKSIIADGFSK